MLLQYFSYFVQAGSRAGRRSWSEISVLLVSARLALQEAPQFSPSPLGPYASGHEQRAAQLARTLSTQRVRLRLRSCAAEADGLLRRRLLLVADFYFRIAFTVSRRLGVEKNSWFAPPLRYIWLRTCLRR